MSLEWKIINQRLRWFQNFNSWSSLSQNKNIPIDFILAHPEYPWDYKEISQHRELTISHILANLEKPWNWYYITIHPNITFKDMISNKELPWLWCYIFMKSDITLFDIEKYSSILLMYVTNSIGLISRNPSIFKIRSDDSDYITLVRQHMAARQIQRHWRQTIANPVYLICRNRIHREFMTMTGAPLAPT